MSIDEQDIRDFTQSWSYLPKSLPKHIYFINLHRSPGVYVIPMNGWMDEWNNGFDDNDNDNDNGVEYSIIRCTVCEIELLLSCMYF